ncbi:alpha/beta hydrolase [Roseisolibacter sp. H3M3-2]|uniref:alpha/beta fold hydrolase n=1 Tax=Roseisolibacter sp. H3M3-2 TaxID=3031323 RepID=UPI0023DAFAF4|nr:alpha/beta hydrolase [Roseisolibacter sp. H3M3-2]MDF1505547.1 alpha/beta hydrolase [Roseisolibacter sp. H3M3-2]
MPLRPSPRASRVVRALAAVGVLACDAPEPLAPRATVAAPTHAHARRASPAGARPTIVLVHGAFADATGWQDVIPILQRAGYPVIAVQNPLTSVGADVASTKRVIDAQPGAVIAVGHSYGGVAISGAAAGNPKVRALVYVAAYAPDAGESVQALNARFPETPLAHAVAPDAAGFVYIDAARYRDVFAGDVPEPRTRVMAVTQKPAAFATLVDPLPVAPAWRTVPAWYVVARDDRTIHPDLERFLARRMQARTTELGTSHLPLASRPHEVAKVILEAAAETAP